MRQTIIGIDPGKSGGVAVCKDGLIVDFQKYPKTLGEIVDIVKKIDDDWSESGKPLAYIEQVHAFPTDARSAAFKFGTNYGLWQGVLLGLQIEYKTVAPQVWMKPLGLPKDKKERKNKIKALAQNVIDKQNVPMDKKRVTLNTSDAIIISMYGYLKEKVNNMSLDKKLDVFAMFKQKEKNSEHK
tara:strand:+ start:1801 stop:2352 length:552 start_codon:yes stop_codon:yes gene_type:complete